MALWEAKREQDLIANALHSMATTDHVRDERLGVIKIRENNTKVQRQNQLQAGDNQAHTKNSKHSLYTLEQKVINQSV